MTFIFFKMVKPTNQKTTNAEPKTDSQKNKLTGRITRKDPKRRRHTQKENIINQHRVSPFFVFLVCIFSDCSGLVFSFFIDVLNLILCVVRLTKKENIMYGPSPVLLLLNSCLLRTPFLYMLCCGKSNWSIMLYPQICSHPL